MVSGEGILGCTSQIETEAILIARYYTIFNLSQCEGLDCSALDLADESAYSHNPIAEAEALIANFADIPKIMHEQVNQAFYDPATDIINVPNVEEFRQGEAYYSTLFHELTHSTGLKNRLNRESLTSVAALGSHEYSKEELAAEFGACFLSLDCGIPQSVEQKRVAYLRGWLSALKSGPRWLVNAANQAHKATNFLKGQVAA